MCVSVYVYVFVYVHYLHLYLTLPLLVKKILHMTAFRIWGSLCFSKGHKDLCTGGSMKLFYNSKKKVQGRGRLTIRLVPK